MAEREPETSLPGLIAHEFDLALLEEYPGRPQRRRPELDYHQLSELSGSPARRIYATTRRGASQHPALTAVRQALAAAIQASSAPSDTHLNSPG